MHNSRSWPERVIIYYVGRYTRSTRAHTHSREPVTMALGRVPYRNSGSGLYIIIARDLASEPVQRQQQQPLDNLWVARVRVGALMCQ